jgi:hypothetical protein
MNHLHSAPGNARNHGHPHAPATISDVHLTVRNAGGSVQHYYHFLLGFLVPLVRAWNAIVTTADVGDVFVRSCAVMDPLLRQLRLPGLVIVAAADHAAMQQHCAHAPMSGELVFATIDGYDFPARYDVHVFAAVREQLFLRFSEEIRQERQELDRCFTGAGPRIVLVRRLPADAFYVTPDCEIKTAGAERRSIANIDELCAALRRNCDNLLLTALEGSSLYYQMALFSAADIIICQHGAALANLVWARPRTHVIEIIPRTLTELIGEADFFGDLARCLSLTHERLWQDQPHGPVGLAELSGMLRRIQANGSRAASPLLALAGVPKTPKLPLSWRVRSLRWRLWRRARLLLGDSAGRRHREAAR